MDMANLQAIILVEKKGVTFKCLLQKGLDSIHQRDINTLTQELHCFQHLIRWPP
jgi:hypothetical protein